MAAIRSPSPDFVSPLPCSGSGSRRVRRELIEVTELINAQHAHAAGPCARPGTEDPPKSRSRDRGRGSAPGPSSSTHLDARTTSTPGSRTSEHRVGRGGAIQTNHNTRPMNLPSWGAPTKRLCVHGRPAKERRLQAAGPSQSAHGLDPGDRRGGIRTLGVPVLLKRIRAAYHGTLILMKGPEACARPIPC